MAFEQKEGNFACFQKTSKAGSLYYNGKVVLQGKEYSVSIFEKVSKKGDKYLSGIIEEPKQPQTQKEVKKIYAFKEDFLDDDIPF